MTIKPTHLNILLWLIAIHSLGVGLVLIVLSPSALELFGYVGYSGRFFQMQGGVFHVVMVIFYLLAARALPDTTLVDAIVAVKLMAAVFLVSYYLFFEPISVIMLSGLADGGMGLAVLVLRLRMTQTESQ